MRATALARATGGPPAAVNFRSADGRWWLWRPCPRCAGVVLPVRRRAVADGHPCPECQTRRRRREAGCGGPAVWFDTWLLDWVVRVPCGELTALVPIEIPWYDADWAQVHRAAADIAYGPDWE